MPTKRTEQRVEEWLSEQLSDTMDFEERSLGKSIKIAFMKSLSDSDTVKRFIVVPSYEMDLPAYESYIATFPGCEKSQDKQKVLEFVLKGYIYIRIEANSYLFDAKKTEYSGISANITEAIVQGPNDALTENIETNMNLIRRRYQSKDLKIEPITIGNVSKTTVAVMYDASRVDREVLEEMRKRLSKISVDILQSAGELEKYLSERKYRMFPTTIVTERPDRVVFNLAEGKVALLMDTVDYAIIAPSIFNDFFTAMDDKIQVPLVGWFMKIIRYVGLFITVTLPAFYVAFTSYNPEILKVQITLLIAGSRAAVPYPSFVEVGLMLLMMEFLIEASLRLPKAIGPTATTVGGLILGQAATQAGLVSNIMIIIVSAVAISNFVIPLNMMAFTVRVLKYFFIFFAAIFGLIGIVVSMIGLIMYLSEIRSFGKPYMKIFAIEGKQGKGDQQNG
ncbi:spore germination protein [Paenibacillus lentus]|uniref:Spore germination protein n=1 Tax=Paenibacillus lentus TaxID=1338368 RepID=A0A3S8RTR8_9BACL|nr:spore germination protein [Paenibacillus lentus]AZK46332.1 spore germination protein [Paenibacillus lentus]